MSLKGMNNDTPNERAKERWRSEQTTEAELAEMAGHASGFAEAARS